MQCELALGKIRRWCLRAFWPGYVAKLQSNRKGSCTEHDVIDSRDLKFIRPGCDLSFDSQDDPFANPRHFGFACWGYAELIGFSLLLATLTAIMAWLIFHGHPWAWLPLAVGIVLWLEVIWFFRDPERSIPQDADALVSPADGTITHIETIEEPGFSEPVLRISIFLSVFNVHVNRSPRESQVTSVRYFRGEYLDARDADCAKRNEQLWLDLEEPGNGRRIRVKQIAGAIARRIVCAVKAGDRLAAGERYGMIKFGSRTDVLLPAKSVHSIQAKVGDKVNGGVTILVRLEP